MSKLKSLLLLSVLFFAVSAAKAQTKNTDIENFYIGTWKLMVSGLPNGDTEMYLIIEKKDGQLTGSIGGKNGEGANKLTKASIDKETFNANFIGGGYNVPLYIDKKGDNKVEGSMNDMFEITGTKEK